MARRAVLSAVSGVAALVASAALDVREFGAVADGETDNTAAIQRAIDVCAERGGGTVLVPGGGVYKTYTLGLRSGVELRIDRGATLKGGEDGLKYPPFPPSRVWRSDRCPRWNRRAMFYTVGQTNVAITGSGTIDGNAEAFHERVDGRWKRVSDTNLTGRCVFFAGCRDVRFDDVLVYHPCGWSTWFLDCDRVQCRGVRIECHRQFPNGDGLHFGGCRDVTVSDCIVDAQDDALILRAHQEQMYAPRPCERVTVANCTLRSNQSAIRIGWTGDAEVKDATFTNIVCPYSRLGVQFNLPNMPDPAYCRDPARGNGIPLPDFPLVPFAAQNLRFDNLQVNCYESPFYVFVGPSEKVAYIRDVSFSNCRFVSQKPPRFRFRPEHGVSGWRFSNVSFDIRRPRGSRSPDTGLWFEHAKDVTFDNVTWNCGTLETPEWTVVVEQVGPDGRRAGRTVTLNGARQEVSVERLADGVRRFVCERLTDGCQTWAIRVEIEERETSEGRTYAGRVANADDGLRVVAFRGPFYDGVRAPAGRTVIQVPEGRGRRQVALPRRADTLKRAPGPDAGGGCAAGWYRGADGLPLLLTGFCPDASGLDAPWLSVDTPEGGVRADVRDAAARPKRLVLRHDPYEERCDLAVEQRLRLSAGETCELGEMAFRTRR